MSSPVKDITTDKSSKDKELDDLLDDALEDFDALKNTENTKAAKEQKPNEPPAGAEGEKWDEEFYAKFLKDQMAALCGGGVGGNIGGDESLSPEQMQIGLEKMAEAAMQAYTPGLESQDPQFVDSIAQALQGLKEGSENLNAEVPPMDFANMFSSLNIGGGDAGGDGNPFMPFVQTMMQSLLSAEVLLPSLKDLLEKYPAWLAENEGKIDPADKERYVNQQELFKVICAELELEKPDDSADVKNERFKSVLEKMQKLHEYGQPPTDLVGDADVMPQLPTMNDPSQCNLM